MSTAQDVIDLVRQLISDEVGQAVAGNRWSDEELLDWITDAQRAVVELKPEAYALTDVFGPVVGSSRQRLNAAAVARLIRVEANTVSDANAALGAGAGDGGGDPTNDSERVWVNPLVHVGSNPFDTSFGFVSSGVEGNGWGGGGWGVYLAEGSDNPLVTVSFYGPPSGDTNEGYAHIKIVTRGHALTQSSFSSLIINDTTPLLTSAAAFAANDLGGGSYENEWFWAEAPDAPSLADDAVATLVMNGLEGTPYLVE